MLCFKRILRKVQRQLHRKRKTNKEKISANKTGRGIYGASARKLIPHQEIRGHRLPTSTRTWSYNPDATDFKVTTGIY